MNIAAKQVFKWRSLICRMKGHDWIYGGRSPEFTPLTDRCWRCDARTTWMPHGDCIYGHPIHEHYVMGDDGFIHRTTLDYCPTGPR